MAPPSPLISLAAAFAPAAASAFALASLVLLVLPACSPAAQPAPQPGPALDLAALFPRPASPDPAGSIAPTTDPTVTPLSPAQPSSPPHLSTSAPAPGPAPAPCQADQDCGYDPTHRTCGADPRFNKQPPLVDQGIICYCDSVTRACGTLRVDPAPCEGDTSCAVRLEPRPHPVRASAAHAYEKPRACRTPRVGEPRRTLRHVTCERTNICTMHIRECAP